MVKLQYSKPAVADLKAIHQFISNDSPANAKQFVRQLKNRIKKLKTWPEMGRKIFPEKFPDLRQVLYKSYRVIYLYENSVVTIITIHHQARLIENVSELKKYMI